MGREPKHRPGLLSEIFDSGVSLRSLTARARLEHKGRATPKDADGLRFFGSFAD